MANLNMGAQEGRISQAQDVQTATNFGNRIARPIETQKAVHGMYGDASGEMAAADAQMKAAQQVNAVVQDGIGRLTNLQIAEEESKKQLYQQEWQTKEQEARSYSKEKALSDGLDTDAQQTLYIEEREKRTGALKDKYSFMTKVGNDIEQRATLWANSADADYIDRVVIPRRVDNIKAGQIQALDGWNKALADSIATETDLNKIGAILKENKDAVYRFVRDPLFIGTNGAAAAEEIGRKYVQNMMTDSITTMFERNPDDMKSINDLRTALRSTTGDPATDPFFELDPSLRRTMLDQVEREGIRRQAEQDRKLKEYQRENEHAIAMDIITGKKSGPRAIMELEKAAYEGKISPAKQETLTRELYAQQERRQREAERAADRAERQAEKREKLFGPARDALATGLPLDARNPDHVKSADAAFAEAIKRNPKADPLALGKELAAKLGMAPRALVSQANGMVMSKDAKQAVQGAQIISELAEVAPNVIHQLPTETVSKATQLRVGIPNERAQANIDRVRTLTKDQKEEYEKLASKHYRDVDNALKKSFDVKTMPPDVYGHGKEIYRNELMNADGNHEAALEATKAQIRRNYGVTSTNGVPRVMYNPPEGTDGSAQYTIKQYKNDIASLGFKPEQTMLVANAHGTYDVYLVDERGARKGYAMDKDGDRIVWRPDHQAAAKEHMDELKAAAQKKREEYLKPSTNPFLNVPAASTEGFVPKGAKASKQVNTSEPKFGKFTSETK